MNVDKRIIDAIIEQESGGNSAAISKKGARNLAQIMPATAQNPGYGVEPLKDQSVDEQYRFANDYIGALLKKYNNDVPLALAAYNAGPGNVHKYGGIPPFKETKNYVRNITKKLINSLNPISSASADEMPVNGKLTPAYQDLSYDAYLQETNQQPQQIQQLQQLQQPQDLSYDAYLQETGNQDWEASAGKIGNQGLGSYASELVGNIIPDTKNIATGLYDFATTPVNETIPAIAGGIYKTGKNVINNPGDYFNKNTLVNVGNAVRDKPVSAALMATPLLRNIPLGSIVKSTVRGTKSAASPVIDVIKSQPIGTQYNTLIANDAMAATAAKMPQLNKAALANMSRQDLLKLQSKIAAPNNFAPGILPTASMIASDIPGVADLETLARLSQKGAFFARDEANKISLYKLVKSKAWDKSHVKAEKELLNIRTTPMRENALTLANQQGQGVYLKALNDKIFDFQTQEELRYNPNIKKIIRPAEEFTGPNSINAGAGDVYGYRKILSDAQNSRAPMTTDATTNAVKSEAFATREIKKAIDEGLDLGSNGEFTKYLQEHRAGMIPISEGEAFGQVINAFKNAPQIADDIPNMTPAALRTAINSKTYSKSGRDLLTSAGRADAKKLIDTGNAMERAASPRAAVMGSQTTPLALQLQKDIIDKVLANGGTQGMAANILKTAKSYFSGQKAIEEALLNPDKLNKFINEALNKGKQSKKTNAAMSAVGASNLHNGNNGK